MDATFETRVRRVKKWQFSALALLGTIDISLFFQKFLSQRWPPNFDVKIKGVGGREREAHLSLSLSLLGLLAFLDH